MRLGLHLLSETMPKTMPLMPVTFPRRQQLREVAMPRRIPPAAAQQSGLVLISIIGNWIIEDIGALEQREIGRQQSYFQVRCQIDRLRVILWGDFWCFCCLRYFGTFCLLLSLMQQSQLNDKIKYWQYHLKKNKKAEQKPTTSKKTPQKKKSNTKTFHSAATPINTFNNTIEKLKGLLQSTQTHTTAQKPSKRQKKQNVVKSKQCKNSEVKGLRSISQLGTTRLKLSQGLHPFLINSSKSKSKSRSKSKSQLIGKKSKDLKMGNKTCELKPSKGVRQGKGERNSPVKKKSRKEGGKGKIVSLGLEDSEERRKIMETVIINLKTDKSFFETQSTHFKIWEQFQQASFNHRQTATKTINKYLLSFAQHISYTNRPEPSLSLRSSRKSFQSRSLQTIIKSQQSKLLQIRLELSKLKDCANLSIGLEHIINKVNENISSLKRIQSSQPQKIQQSSVGLQAQVESFRSSSKSSCNSSLSQQVEIREPILQLDSLIISQDDQEASHQRKTEWEREAQFLKEQSSICLLDSKFLNVSIPNSLRDFDRSDVNAELIKSHQKVAANIDYSELLLSGSSNSETKLLSPSPEKERSPIVFTVNQVKYNKQGESAGCEQVVVEAPFQKETNKELLSSFSSIITEHIRVEQPTQNYGYSEGELGKIEQHILDSLITQIFPFFTSHQSLLQQLLRMNPMESFNVEGEERRPIKYTNQYLLDLTNRFITHSYSHFQLAERLQQPLGVQPSISLRYIRLSLQQEYPLQPFQHYDQQDYREEIDQQMTIIQQRSQVVTKDHISEFQQHEGQLDNAYQIILHRCLFEAVNNILDEFRPYGIVGIPAFYHLIHPQSKIPLPSLLHRTKQRLNRLLQIQLGENMDPSSMPAQAIAARLSKSYSLSMKSMRDEVEFCFVSEEDDTVERYQLMIAVEEELLSREIWAIYKAINHE